MSEDTPEPTNEELLNTSFTIQPVPPPTVAPTSPSGEALGLPRGLRVASSDRQFRCSACNGMQQSGSFMVWVPDGVRRGDPEWSVTEAARLNAWNGHLSGWCLPCAQRLKAPAPRGARSEEPMRRQWWQFWRMD